MTARHDVILADPPWSFSSTKGIGSSRSVENQYRVMTPAEVCALDPFVNRAAEPICRLFLWVPDSQLNIGLQVLGAWGFSFKKVAFVWVKMSRRQLTERQAARAIAAGESLVWTPEHAHRRLAFGAGRTTRNGAELCLLGARGPMAVASKRERQVILSPVREHSRKPPEQYERIEAMYPQARYLELFARQRRKAWAAWGLETNKFTEQQA